MTKRTLIIECGVAETRAALIEDGRAARFWFGPARGDEGEDAAPRAGRRFAGRVRAIDRALNAAFVDIGDGRDSFLPIKKSYGAGVTEGALIVAEVKSPPRQGKGAVLKFVGGAEGAAAAPGRLAPIEDAALEAMRAIGAGARAMLVDDGRACGALKSAMPEADIHYEERPVGLFESFGAEAELEAAFARAVPIAGGGRLIIDETQALTAIDVDTGALKASSPARLREKIAAAAAFEAARQINLRELGGHVVIDFPALETKSGRDRFRGQLGEALSSVDGVRALSFSKSGLCAFTAPHRAQSLMERFTEPAPADPVDGRRYILDCLAKSALRRLEGRLRAHPGARMRVVAGRALGAYLDRRPVWLDRLRDRYGARFEIAADNQIEERSFDLSEQ